MLLWPEKSSASFYWPLAAAAAPPIMPATSRQLAASFFTQLAGGDSYVAVWRLPVCGRAQHGSLAGGPSLAGGRPLNSVAPAIQWVPRSFAFFAKGRVPRTPAAAQLRRPTLERNLQILWYRQHRTRPCKERKDGAPTVLEREGRTGKMGHPSFVRQECPTHTRATGVSVPHGRSGMLLRHENH